MRAGQLDRKITVQRAVSTQDAYGQPIPEWSAVAADRWARYRPLRGEERFVTQQTLATEQVEFTIRWDPDTANISPTDRLIYPAPGDPDENSPAANTTFDILSVAELGRREGLVIVAVRRAELVVSTGGDIGLDFSQAQNSMYIPLLEDI